MIHAQFDTKQNYYNRLDVEYDQRYDCEASGCDSICRCGRITNARIESFYWDSLVESACVVKPQDALDKYILDRLVRRVFTPDLFEISWSPGYYGDEIDSVKIDTDSFAYREFARKVEVFNRLESVTQQIQMILTLEYGFLLPEIAAVDEWEVREFLVKEVHASADVLKRISQPVAWHYKDSPPKHGIHGVVVRKEGLWRLVDGFHRFAAWTGQYEKRGWEPKPKARRKIRLLAPKGDAP